MSSMIAASNQPLHWATLRLVFEYRRAYSISSTNQASFSWGGFVIGSSAYGISSGICCDGLPNVVLNPSSILLTESGTIEFE